MFLWTILWRQGLLSADIEHKGAWEEGKVAVTDLRLMAVYAHPDDESFGTGGTLAKYAAEGVFVSLLTATRGEAGEINEPGRATPETLGQVREKELRCACEVLGVGELRFLDCRDGQVQSCDRTATLGKIVLAIRELKPAVVVTFGPEGVYGHPDHIAIGELASAAFEIAGDPGAFPEQLVGGLQPFSPLKLYYRLVPRSQFRRMLDDAKRAGIQITLGDIDLDHFGSDDSEITAIIDVLDYVEHKSRAIACHRTQIQPDNPFRKLPPEKWREFSRYEHFRLARSRLGEPAGIETDLFAGLR